jgi:O-antigen/teichoic acid export membrane protein
MSSTNPSMGTTARWFHRLGVDRAVFFSASGRLVTTAMAPVTLFLIGMSLTPAEQGFYFTFNSIIALQAVVELGLAVVVLQFTSHEMTGLRWDGRVLAGDESGTARLASLLRFTLAWYAVVSLVLVFLVLPLGDAFLSRAATAAGVAWRTPWHLVVIASAVLLLMTPFLSVLEGTGQVAEVAMIRAAQDILATLALWIGLRLHLALIAAIVFVVVRLLVTGCCIVARYRQCFVKLLRVDSAMARISWIHEIWPFQWRIAISWLSGYFIFQLFTPLLFAFRGAVAAGQMGMSIAVTSAVTNTALAWVNTKAAPFGTLIAARRYDDLDGMFFRAAKQSLALAAAGLVTIWCAIVIGRVLGTPLADRLLLPLPLALLFATAFINQVIGAQAVYLRAHKKEPFLSISVVAGFLVGTSVYVAGREFGALGMSVAYFTAMVGIAVAASAIFIDRRRLWHEVN